MAFQDPVCGMSVDPSRARAKGVYDGQTVYFCSESCRRSFERDRAAPGGPVRPA